MSDDVEPQPATHIAIPVLLWEQLRVYLGRQPHDEVAQLITELRDVTAWVVVPGG